MALAIVDAFSLVGIHPGEVLVRDPHRRIPAVPAQAALLVELVERVGAGRVDHRQPRHALDQPERLEFGKRLAEGARVAQVAARHDDPVGRLPRERLEHAEHDRLLAFEPERIDAVDQVDAQLAADLAHAHHGIVEVAGDLHGQGTVVERLRELAVGDSCRSR